MTLDDDGWRCARTDLTAPFTAAAASDWDSFPAICDLMPWYAPGVFPTRGWVIAPSADILKRRWNALRAEPDADQRSRLFKVGRDADLETGRPPLVGTDVHHDTIVPLDKDRSTVAAPIRYGYRAFDRQWIIPDSRVMDMPRRDLWAARRPGQVFVVEQHRRVIKGGPGLLCTALIPDFDHFKGSEGGRTLPSLNPDGTPNLAAGLVDALAVRLRTDVAATDVLAYIAGVVAHPAFTETFAAELTTPGVRVPLTCDAAVWADAVDLGKQVLWLHTFGAAGTDETRPVGRVRFAADDARRITNTRAITAMPATMAYDADRRVLVVGDGEFGPVAPAVWGYAVGGKNVLKSWFAYRKAHPGGRKGSPLDDIHVTAWPPEWTGELLDLLSVLTRLVDLEPRQADVLARVLAGPTFSMADLADRRRGAGVHAAGDAVASDAVAVDGTGRVPQIPSVTWPTTAAHRAPRYPVLADADGTTLAIGT